MLSPLRRLLTRLGYATHRRQTVFACFVDELTPGDERELRALLAAEEERA
jgi:hypothetical protein